VIDLVRMLSGEQLGNERAERFYDAAGWERDGEKVDDFQGATVTESRYRKQLRRTRGRTSEG